MSNSPLTEKYIHLATDHAGFEYKEAVLSWLKESGYKVIDHGAFSFEAEDDFPDFISLAAAAVSKAPEDSVGIIFGGSGQGEAMVANRFPNVRATAYYGGQSEIITLSKRHNDANVLSFGARFVTIEEVKRSIEIWLSTETFSEEKYKRRNQKIEHITRHLKSI